MCAKKTLNQLDSLFSELQQEAAEELPDAIINQDILQPPSELNEEEEFEIQPGQHKLEDEYHHKPIIIQADQDKITLIDYPENHLNGNGFLTNEGYLSATHHQAVLKNSLDDSPSVLAYSQKHGQNLITFEFIQSPPERRWDQEDVQLVEQITEQLNLALENAQLFQQTQQALAETQQRAQELLILNELSKKLSSNLDERTVFDYVYQATSMLMSTVNFYIALYDEQNDIITFPYVYVDQTYVDENHPEAQFWAGAIPVEGLTGYVIRSKQPLLFTQDIKQELMATQIGFVQIGDVAAESWLGVPMMIGDKVTGVISVQSETQPNLYNQHHANLLSTIGNQAAIAIENARLVNQLRRRANQLQTAAEIARDISSALSLDNLFHRVVNLVNERFGFYHASIFILDENKEYAVVKESTGEAGLVMKQIQHKLAVGSKSIIGYVTQTGEPLIVNDVSKSDIHRPNPLLPDTKSELGIPLIVGDEIIGALDVQSTQVNAFTQDDVTILQTLGDQIAIAVQNTQAYELSQQALQEMQHADQLKTQFLANMSHELRTPLNSIIGFSRVILKGIDGPVTEQQKQDVTAIYNSGQHLLNLINDILDLSKIEAGKMDLLFEENVQLADVIQSILPTVKGLIKDKPIELIEEVPSDLPRLRADPTKIRQVLLNLLSNAAKFTEEGSITVQACQRIFEAGASEVIVKVKDTGIGIDKEHLDRLFQPFSQVDPSPTRKTGGSGLGLSISKYLVEMHGGTIGVSSEPGKGSEFFFTLPLPSAEQAHSPATDESLDQPNPSVFAIESEELILNMYERYLSEHQVEVVKFNALGQVLNLAIQRCPFAILIDPYTTSLTNPEANGWELISTLKSHPSTKNIPIIVCSIYDEKEKAFSLGVSEYLYKPILEEDLIAVIKRFYPDKK
jgi:signal transduction histidine kinase/CheY-like chemotaxis protein